MTRARRLFRVSALLTVAAMCLTSGCGGDERADSSGGAASQTPTLPSSAAGGFCVSEAVRGQQVRFGVGGATDLAGVLYGTGRIGVVFAHQAAGTLCDWASYPRELGERGYRALAFDFSGNGASVKATNDLKTDVAAAVAFLRRSGVSKVVLLGASMGGTAVLTAAAELRPPVAGVVSLSAPRTWLDASALLSAPKLAVPVLYIAGERDGPYAADARELYAATPEAGRRLVVVDSAGHGSNLVDPNLGGVEMIARKVRGEIDAFLASVAPAN